MPQMGQLDKTLQAGIESARTRGVSDADIELYLKQQQLVPANFTLKEPNLMKEAQEFIGKSPKLPTQANIEPGFAKTALSIAGGALPAAALAYSGVGAPWAGAAFSAGSALTDTLVNKFMGLPTSYPLSSALGITSGDKELSGSPIFNAAASTYENALLGEGIGRAIGIPLKIGGNAIFNILKEADVAAGSTPWKGTPKIPWLLNKAEAQVAKFRDKALNKFFTSSGKGSVSGALSEYNPTFTQYQDRPHHLLQSFENLFARKQKEIALKESGDIALDKAGEKLSSLAGRKVSLKDADILSQRVQNAVGANFDNLNDAINDTTSTLDLIQPDWRRPVKGLSAQAQKLKDTLAELTDAASIFYPEGKKKVYQLSKNQLNPIKFAYYPTPVLNAVMDDAVELDKLLNLGEIKIGSKGKIFKGISSKSDAKGYQFMRMITENYDNAKQLLDTDSLTNTWTKYKNSKMGPMLYNQADRANIDQFFKDLGQISTQLEGSGPSRYLTLRLGTGAVSLGAGLVTGLSSGFQKGLVTAGAISGGAIGLNQLGKLMTNPNTARLMIAMTKGGPLNMSPAMAGRVIGRALRNQPMTMYTKNDKGEQIAIEGRIDSTGKFVADLPE